MNNLTEEHHASPKDPLAGVDFVSSILLIVFSVVVTVLSLKMSRPDGSWYAAPGLIPLLVSTSLIVMGLGLLVASIRNRGFSQLIAKYKSFSFSDSIRDIETKRALWIILLSTFYVLVLTGRMFYEIASFIYLVATFYVFWREGGWLKIVLISVLVPLAMSFVFRVVFLTHMPGESIFDWLFG